jgi:hypothetical protein
MLGMSAVLAGLVMTLVVVLGWKCWYSDWHERRVVRTAAKGFFEACGREDWDAVSRFWPTTLDDRIKSIMGGLRVKSLGEPFRSKDYAGWFIPYEIEMAMKRAINVRSDNPAKRCVLFLDPEYTPDAQALADVERLPDNEKYEKLTPEEAVQAFCDACAKSDVDEAKKFLHPSIPAADAEKVVKEIGSFASIHVGDGTPGKEEGSWAVPWEFHFVKKFNLAMRNDNPAKRYVFDGGI